MGIAVAQDSPHLHVGVALDGAGWHSASWRDPSIEPTRLASAAYWSQLAATAERGLLDFLSIDDSLAAPGDPDDGSRSTRRDVNPTRLDANLIAATLAPITTAIGLIPTVTTTHTEPFHVSTAIATLDYTSLGRAGWQVRVSPWAAESNNFGRRDIPAIERSELSAPTPPAALVDLFDEAAEAVEVVRRLWDSWEDDAEIRDVATRRFIDRDKLHYIDFAGSQFSVRGPSITPRPPQGQPVVAALAHRDAAYELAARAADIVFTTPTVDGGATVLSELLDASSAVSRADEALRVYADVVVFLDTATESGEQRLRRLNDLSSEEFTSDAVVFTGSAAELADLLEQWSQVGFDGFRLRPGVAPVDLEVIAADLVPELQRRSRFRTAYPGERTSLRGLLGLPTSVPNRYATGTPAA